MKIRFKRLAALVLDGMLTIGILAGTAPSAGAEETAFSGAEPGVLSDPAGFPQSGGESPISPDRILNLYKFIPNDGTMTDAEGGSVPLSGVEFEIYYVADLLDVLFGDVVLSKTPTAQELAAYRTKANFITTIETNASGFGSFNFSAAGYGDSVYLVVEKDSTAAARKSDPFYISVPAANPNGDGWLYTVSVNPKNAHAGLEVDLDVTTVGGDAGTFCVGEEITYIIRGGLPWDLCSVAADGIARCAQNYTITDTLDARLDYVGNVEVKLCTEVGAEIPLTSEEDYVLINIPAAEAQEGAEAKDTRLAVRLTQAGMKRIVENLDRDGQTPELRIFFTAAINSSAMAGEPISNNAFLYYTDASGFTYIPGEVPEQKRPVVHIDSASVPACKIPEDFIQNVRVTFPGCFAAALAIWLAVCISREKKA